MNKETPWRPGNRLLAALPAAVCARLKPDLQLVPLPVGKVLYESGAHQHQMYFLRSGIVSLLYVMQNGDTGEIAMTGNEGMVGTAVLLDSQSTPTRAVVQVAGEALVLKAEAIDREFKRGGPFQVVVLRYMQAVIAQMTQTAICSRHHSVEKQLCRWLLLSLDRVDADEIKMTQELISNMLGVRREGITEAAGRLQEAGLIQYSRGNIRVINREGFEQRCCECYRVVHDEYERLLRSPVAV